jgi:DNA-binding ferritin-like protein (oxidative damage protectant)
MKTSTITEEQAIKVATKLNYLLANYSILYMNLRGFHWNLKGENFFTLHPKFEEYYNDAASKIDEIAERVQSLGYMPLHSYSDYRSVSDIKEITDVADGKICMEHLLEGYEIILRHERQICIEAENVKDEGTVSMITDYIRQQEKTVWMLKSCLS